MDISGPRQEGEYEDNVTPLMLAVINESTEITQLLIRNGADLNMMDDSGKTALDYAARDAKHGSHGNPALSRSRPKP